MIDAHQNLSRFSVMPDRERRVSSESLPGDSYGAEEADDGPEAPAADSLTSPAHCLVSALSDTIFTSSAVVEFVITAYNANSKRIDRGGDAFVSTLRT